MTILALEFSTELRSVAILAEGRLRGEASEFEARAFHPLGLIERALDEAAMEREQVDSLIVGLGPGSYSGIRLAISIGQGWQLAGGVKLTGASSMECIAANAREEGIRGRLAVVVDAQRGEFYQAVYETDLTGVRIVEPPRIARRDEIRNHSRSGAAIVGPDAERLIVGGQNVSPKAALLGKSAGGIGNPVSGSELQPIYLRVPAFLKRSSLSSSPA
jgi:tRNA threonylcarbamoyl adenosine modification protein YeaZ